MVDIPFPGRIVIDEIIYLILTSVSEAEEAGQPTQSRLPLHEDDHLRRQGSLQRLQLPTTSLLDQQGPTNPVYESGAFRHDPFNVISFEDRWQS
jgi:hypothetical protein